MIERGSSDSSRLRQELIDAGLLTPSNGGQYMPTVRVDPSRPRLTLDDAAHRAARRARERSRRVGDVELSDVDNTDIAELAQRRSKKRDGGSR